mgnify:FL=1
MKRQLKSWGNTHIKEVTELKQLSDGVTTLSIGNSNSYGDAGIPVFDNYFEPIVDSKKDFVSSKNTIGDYLKSDLSFLTAIPGKSNVTLGGAVASDVHGKDGFWGGSFQKNIDEIMIQLPNKAIEICSENTNPEIFYATIGGYGLTGNILGVKLKRYNKSLPSLFKTNTKKGSGLDNLFKNFSLENGAYSVGWVNLLHKDFSWILETSVGLENEEREIKRNLDMDKSFNFAFPFIGKNRLKSMEAINSIYYFLNSHNNLKIKSAHKVLFPLSSFSDTRNLAKNRKIIQIQFSLPENKKDKVEMILHKLINKQHPILCSVKRLSKNVSDLNLSFVQDGWTFAVDFPFDNFSYKEIRKFYKYLIENEGKIYLAKDSTLIEEEFKNMYQNFPKWKEIVKEIDPKKKFQSNLSIRLGLKNW